MLALCSSTVLPALVVGISVDRHVHIPVLVEKKVKLNVPNTSDGMQTLIFKPLDPGIVLEKLVVDYGGYKKSYLFMNESKSKRDNR